MPDTIIAGTDVDDPALRACAAFTDTRGWLEQAVIGLNLCPFAKAVFAKRQIRYCISAASDTDTLFDTFCNELQLLATAQPDVIDTTLLIHPGVLAYFDEYNDFLALADNAIRIYGLEGVIQVASFHPQYQFDNTLPEEIENYTNRSPHPMLHLLREQSIERAVAGAEHADRIVDRNKETLRRMGLSGWRQLPFIAGNK